MAAIFFSWTVVYIVLTKYHAHVFGNKINFVNQHTKYIANIPYYNKFQKCFILQTLYTCKGEQGYWILNKNKELRDELNDTGKGIKKTLDNSLFIQAILKKHIRRYIKREINRQVGKLRGCRGKNREGGREQKSVCV